MVRPAAAVQIYESNVEASDLGAPFWVANDVVMFLGFSGEHVVRKDGYRKRVVRVTTWNIRTNEINRYAEAHTGLCYDKGNIAYLEIDHAERLEWTSFGRFPGDVRRMDGDIKFDSATCLPVRELPALPDWTKDRSIVRLRPEHGFLDLGPQREPKNTPIRLVSTPDSNPVALPVRRRDFLEGRASYLPFKGAYFLEGKYFLADSRHPYGGYNSDWPMGMPRTSWWLFPNGTVEEIVIPYARWARGVLAPTKAGTLALSNGFTAGIDGIYLVDRKGLNRRLLRGLFAEHAVSDDGCRLAVVRMPQPAGGKRDYWTVTALDVCQGG